MLNPGSHLGRYEVVALLGAGGMGEVYRARDTRLNRDVALKILPAAFADPDRRQRFEREASAIASLNHPHICQLYDADHDAGVEFLVLELLEGEPLDHRLEKGPLPVDIAIQCAIEIADGLSAAHRRGIVHRDLKPGNVMLTKHGTKLLDFGLATAGLAPGADPADVTTVMRQTQAGAVLGTLAYMAPEQLQGQRADARSDIFALGLTLYEMLKGRRSPTAIGQPPVIHGVSQPLAHILERCLAPDRDKRWQTADDVKHELTWAAAVKSMELSPSGDRRTSLLWALLAVAVVAAVAGIGWMFAGVRSVTPTRTLQLNVNPPAGGEFRPDAGIAMSPDGSTLAFVARVGDSNQLWVRRLESAENRELAGTDGAAFPFWSPDSQSIAFFASGKLKRTELAGGTPVVLCDVTRGRGGTWNKAGTIVFNGYNDGPLLRVSASGGTPVPLTTLDATRGENSHRWPEFLPDGRRLLYFARSADPQKAGMFLTSLDHPEVRKLILQTRESASYADTSHAAGHLLWTRGDDLLAQAFDARSETLEGKVSVVVHGPFAGLGGSERRLFSAATDGTLAVQRAEAQTTQLTWYGRDGRITGTAGAPESYVGEAGGYEMAISPAETHVALIRRDGNAANVWVMDLARGITVTRLNGTAHPLWSPDEQRVAYVRGAPPNIYIDSLNGGHEERVTNTMHTQQLWDWSPDGTFLLYTELLNEVSAAGQPHFWVVSLTGDRKPVAFAPEESAAREGRFSPDGKWIAYTSEETLGRAEIYLRRFPSDGRKWRVSDKGGSLPRWRHDQRELMYVAPNGTLTVVSIVTTERDVQLSTPTPLWTLPGTFDVARDGKQFLVLRPVAEREASPMVVVTNWPAIVGQ